MHRHLLGNRKPAWLEYLMNNKYGIKKLANFLKRMRALDKDYNGAGRDQDPRLRLTHNPHGERAQPESS